MFGISGNRPLQVGLNETSKVRDGKITVDHVIDKYYNIDTCRSIDKLLSSEKADEFIKSAKKQNARILSDNIIYEQKDAFSPVIGKFKENLFYRAITKLLPNGTTITNLYNTDNEVIRKAILNKDKEAYMCCPGHVIVKKRGNDIVNYLKYNNKDTNRLEWQEILKNDPIRSKEKLNFNELAEHGMIKAAKLTQVNNKDNKEYHQMLKRHEVYDKYDDILKDVNDKVGT